MACCRETVVSKSCTHEQMLARHGFDLGTPISGSMRPMIRPRRDSVLFVPLQGRLKKGDVALYRRDGMAVMHRVLRVGKTGYIIRGDNSSEKETIREEQIIAVMKGFYRDEQYIEANDLRYRAYAWIWPKLHGLLVLYKRLPEGLRARMKRMLHPVRKT
ncbi:MAG: hypothetical protein IJZ74_06175 [Clostridia bacterium]|nr:hypothetical protein [Clostridia bacterium]